MALGKLCREMQMPSFVLIHFVNETKTGIAPIRLIHEKNLIAVENKVTVNWEGKLVQSKILVYWWDPKEPQHTV